MMDLPNALSVPIHSKGETIANPEELPSLETSETDNLIDQYLYLYTKGAEQPFGNYNLLVEHTNDAGNECTIIIDRQQKNPIYVVGFVDRKTGYHRKYYRLADDAMQVEEMGEYIGELESEMLLQELEEFFGALSGEELLKSRLTTAAYMGEFLDRQPNFIQGGVEVPEFYEGYKAEATRPLFEQQEPTDEVSSSNDAPRPTLEELMADIRTRAETIVVKKTVVARIIIRYR